MRVLGIESTCDETAVAIVTDGREILAEGLWSQTALHAPHGGVVPELAARAHLHRLPDMLQTCIARAGLSWADLDGIAVAGGPGLIGGVLVGVMAAKGLCAVTGLPLLAVNHLEAHALTARFSDGVDFPFLLLLVSGGHAQLLWVRGVGDYVLLGRTLDDAAGEAFDKVAKMLGLAYPGGPLLEALASGGDAGRFPLPVSLRGQPGCDLSFSGLKTAARTVLLQHTPPSDQVRADLAASFQQAVAEQLAERCAAALRLPVTATATALVVAGGVAANAAIRSRLQQVAATAGRPLIVAPPRLCTDNGVMIAWAGLERLRLGLTDGLDFAPRPRWPLAGAQTK